MNSRNSASLPALEDHFQVEGELGRGGFGVVYRGHPRAGGPPVAVKLPHEAIAEDEAARIHREATLLRRLEHPHLTRFFGVFQDRQGRLALVYELVPGEPLLSVVRGSPLEPQRALAILEAAASGLDHLHRAQLVHRDLKSENLMLAPGDHPKILDFGLTRPLAPGATLTATGILTGTPQTMAPELFLGRPATILSDLYAFACVAYECLTGHLPVEGDLKAILTHASSGEPPRIHHAAPDLPPELDPVFLAALARDPARRPRSASALVAAIRGVLEAGPRASGPEPTSRLAPLDPDRTQLQSREPAPAGLSSTAPQEAPRVPEPEASPPRGSWRGGLAVSGLLLVAGLVLGSWSRSPGPPAPDPARSFAPAPPAEPRGLPPGLPDRYREAVQRLTRVISDFSGSELRFVPRDEENPAHRDKELAALHPMVWGNLRREMVPEIREFEDWIQAGNLPEDLPEGQLRNLQRGERLFTNLSPGSAPPLYPFLAGMRPGAPLPFARLGPLWELLQESSRWLTFEEEATGWMAVAVEALGQARENQDRVQEDFHRLIETGTSEWGLPEGPIHWRIGRVGQDWSDYLRTCWEHDHQPTQLRISRALLPVSLALHRAYYAMGRFLAEVPEEEAELYWARSLVIAGRMGEVVSKSYLSTLLPEEILLPRREGDVGWNLLAAVHAKRFLTSRREIAGWREPTHYLIRARTLVREREAATGRPMHPYFHWLLRNQLLVEVNRALEDTQERHRKALQGTPWVPGVVPVELTPWQEEIRSHAAACLGETTMEDWAYHGTLGLSRAREIWRLLGFDRASLERLLACVTHPVALASPSTSFQPNAPEDQEIREALAAGSEDP